MNHQSNLANELGAGEIMSKKERTKLHKATFLTEYCGVRIIAEESIKDLITEEDIADAYARSQKVSSGDISRISFFDNNGFLDYMWETYSDGFERIRRITGYLVGDTTSFNDAKVAEEHDRVKHSL